MRNTFGKLFAILATLVLLFSVAFFTVSLVLRDNDLIGNLYKKQEIRDEVEETTGISRAAELENATVVLLDYMRGERANIKVGANVRGAFNDDIFSPKKEVEHMAEVQQLWLSLDWFSKYGAIGAGVLLLFGFFLMQHGKRRALLSSSILWGCGILGGILAFLGVWAVLDFQSFWTVFHFILFPKTLFQYLSAGATLEAMNELNWVLDSDSIMVNMLMPIFPTIVLRCAICVILEIAAAALIAIFIHFAWRKQGKPSPVADIMVIEHDANEPVPIKGPDLVLAHKLRNAPKDRRDEIIRRAKNGEPLDEPIPAGDPDVSENGEHPISHLSMTASPQGEVSDAGDTSETTDPTEGTAPFAQGDREPIEESSDASQKPSPRGEGVERSETDEVSDSAAPEEDA